MDLPSRRFIEQLPKVELHLHLVGAVGPGTRAVLAAECGVEPGSDRSQTMGDRLVSERGFLDTFRELTARIRRPEHVVSLVEDAGLRLAAAGVHYAEVTVTAGSHLRAGIGPTDLRDALDEGRRRVRSERSIDLAWIVDVSGQHGPSAAWATLQWVDRYQPQDTVAFGLGGPEREVPRMAYREVFRAARSLGLRSTPHAGEHGSHQQVRAALEDLRADRIGHGLAAAGDPSLLRDLVERQVTLEICPTSNVLTGAVASYSEHPLPVLLEAGVPVTIATDDPGVFGADLIEEYFIAAELGQLDRDGLLALVAGGIEAAFCSSAYKAELRYAFDRIAASDPS